jgi:hypothetical protein
MSRTLNEVKKSLPKMRRIRIEARAATLLAEEFFRQILRKAGFFLWPKMRTD